MFVQETFQEIEQLYSSILLECSGAMNYKLSCWRSSGDFIQVPVTLNLDAYELQELLFSAGCQVNLQRVVRRCCRGILALVIS